MYAYLKTDALITYWYLKQKFKLKGVGIDHCYKK